MVYLFLCDSGALLCAEQLLKASQPGDWGCLWDLTSVCPAHRPGLAPLQGAGYVNLELAEVSVGCRYRRSTAGRFDLYMFM